MVEILIPPAVPVGFAPMNIKIQRKSFVRFVIVEKSTVVNPEVLAAVDTKKELKNLSIVVKSFKETLYSKRKKPIVPNRTKNKDPNIAILELMDRFCNFILDFFKFMISFMTTNPIPPKKVNKLIVIITK